MPELPSDLPRERARCRLNAVAVICCVVAGAALLDAAVQLARILASLFGELCTKLRYRRLRRRLGGYIRQ